MGGFHAYYRLTTAHEMKDLSLKLEVEFLSRLLDDLLSAFDCPPQHPVFVRIISRVLALRRYDQTGNPAFW